MKIKYFKYFFSINFLLLKIKFNKLKYVEYNHDFSNLFFYNSEKLKKILLKKKDDYKKDDSDFFYFHSFNWLKTAKNIGGSEVVKISRSKLLQWNKNNHNLYFNLLNTNLLAQRLINLIYHFDFYGSSAHKKDKNLLSFIIYTHYICLKKILKNNQNKIPNSIEINKAVLLFESINKFSTQEIINKILQAIPHDNDINGMHVSMNPQIQSEYINHLIEIKNIFLFFKIDMPKEIDFQITNMTSVLKCFIHKDGSLAFFNGSNNFFIDNINKIISKEDYIKTKNLTNNKNGLSIYENKDIKIILDIVNPTNKSFVNDLHSSTLSFELSVGKEKIISNCGSLNLKNNKKPDYLRYSAAHSTIILNNTNISEIFEKNSFKRAPSKILFKKNEEEGFLEWEASHDGYSKNFKKIVKRNIRINKRKTQILGRDEIISIGLKKNKLIFNIRFHLTSICKALLTRGKMSAIIKTNNSSYLFKTNYDISIEESIIINDFNKVEKTSQIVISGSINNSKKTINWSIEKY